MKTFKVEVTRIETKVKTIYVEAGDLDGAMREVSRLAQNDDINFYDVNDSNVEHEFDVDCDEDEEN